MARYDGTSGNDVYSGTAKDDVAFGNGGDDQLKGLEGDDSLWGGNGNDTLQGGAGNDFIEGGAGNDGILGGSGNDTLLGGSGDDQIYSVGQAEIDGGSGNDFVSLEGSIGNTRGGDGIDRLFIFAEFVGDMGVITIDGFESLVPFVDGEDLVGTLFGDGGNDTLILNVSGLGSNNYFVIDADSGNDYIAGSNLRDRIQGQDGDDTLNGAGGMTACSETADPICWTAAKVTIISEVKERETQFLAVPATIA